ncbi:hypothetical protein Bbelb_186850 [Branchiostoma belcheri]|nr:hypothetical protein Bbelb_186850 [Branchiostoma belcheri]
MCSSQNPDENLAALDGQDNSHLSEENLSEEAEETGQRNPELQCLASLMVPWQPTRVGKVTLLKHMSEEAEETGQRNPELQCLASLMVSWQPTRVGKVTLLKVNKNSQNPDGNLAALDKEGNRVPSKVERTGRGGSMRVEFQCDGCSGGGVALDASTFLREGRKQIAGHSGLHRANSDRFLLYSDDILQVVRDTYPSGDDQDLQLINCPTKDIEFQSLLGEKFVFGDTSRFRKTARQVQQTLNRISGAKRLTTTETTIWNTKRPENATPTSHHRPSSATGAGGGTTGNSIGIHPPPYDDKIKKYHRLSSRVPGIFSQYRYQEKYNRRNKVYRGLRTNEGALFVYGTLRGSEQVLKELLLNSVLIEQEDEMVQLAKSGELKELRQELDRILSSEDELEDRIRRVTAARRH